MSTSVKHDGPVLLFRERPDLILALLGSRAPVAISAEAKASLASEDFGQAVALERRADVVVTVEERGEVRCGFVIEVQRAIDPEKRFSWPLYAASLHARLRKPTTLVIIALDDAVARWARRPIASLQPSHPFVPLVLGPREIPRLTSSSGVAVGDPRTEIAELAVLSALVHGGGADASDEGMTIARNAVRAARRLDRERSETYIDLIWNVIGAAASARLEAEMPLPGYEYQSEYAKTLLAQGRVEGREAGREEGREAGRLDEARRLLYAMLTERGLGPSDAARARAEACTDPKTLERWVVRAASAAAESDAFEG